MMDRRQFFKDSVLRLAGLSASLAVPACATEPFGPVDAGVVELLYTDNLTNYAGRVHGRMTALDALKRLHLYPTVLQVVPRRDDGQKLTDESPRPLVVAINGKYASSQGWWLYRNGVWVASDASVVLSPGDEFLWQTAA